MRSILIKMTFIVGLLSLTTACDKSNKSNSNKLDTNEVLKMQISNKEKSKRLSDIATELLTNDTYMYANSVANKALKIDSENKQAELVAVLTKPVMLMEGFFERIGPILDKFESYEYYGETLSYSEYIERRIYDAELGETDKFLLESNDPHITNEQDAQKFIDTLISSINEIRLFFKNSKNQQINLKLPAKLIAKRLDSPSNDCKWHEVRNGVYENTCDIYKASNVKLARVDQEILQHTIAAHILIMSVSNAYNLDGLIGALYTYQMRNSGREKSKLIRDYLMLNGNNFGILRNPKALHMISELGLDAIAGMNWIEKMQNTICLNKNSISSARDGFLFTEPICIDRGNKVESEKFNKIVALVEDGLSGKQLKVETKNLNNLKEAPKVYKTVINPSVFINGKINSLKSLGLDFNECNNIVSIDDRHLGGIFPLGDVNLIINMRKHKCRSH